MASNAYTSPIDNFRKKLWDDIAFNVASNFSTDREEFLNYISAQLLEAEEIDDEITYLPYEGVGKQRKKIQIDGYVYSELDECLSIFVVLPLEYNTGDPVIATEANRYIGMAAAFLDNAEFIKENAEESAPGYGFACDVIKLYKNVQKYKIYVITDRNRSKSLDELNAITARKKPVECQIWDIERIYDLDKSANGREEIVIDLKEFGIDGIPCMLASETEEYKAYLCNIPGMVLANLYNTYGSRLLEGNVRSFLQVKGKVNKGIRNTILNEPDMFFAYNNGIAATAFQLKTEVIRGITYITELTSLQIVNGGQTTASLANALIKDKKDNAEENIRKISIPMKLSIVEPAKADKLIANIARYANSQNKVSDADLWSNHPFHIQMQKYSRDIQAPAVKGRQYGTYWYYERSNGQYAQETFKCTPKEKERFLTRYPKEQKITKTEFAKYVQVMKMRPDVASTGGQKAFITFAESISKEWGKDSTVFNDVYFRNIVSVALLFRKADSIVRKEPWFRSYKANIVAYTLAKLFYTVESEYPEKAINLKVLWQKQDISDAWANQIDETSYVIYQYLIREDRGIENVTEWAKREACWKGAKELKIQLHDDFVAELQSKYIVDEEKQDAKKDKKASDALSAMVDVVNYGSENWAKLLDWDKTHRVLTPSEYHDVLLAVNQDGGLIANEKKCAKVLKILDKCRIEGFPG